MKPEMKHCAGCGAPNPQHLKVCYACGRTLDQAAPPPAKTYPCRACEKPVPFAAPVCPHCGLAVQAAVPSYGAVQGMALQDFSRVTDALQQASAIGSIGDWEIDPLPDGTTRLKRGIWARITRAGATDWEEGVALVVFGMGALFSLAFAYPKHGEPRPYMLVVAIVFGVLAVAVLVWMLGASEQLRVGRELLERRRTLGKLQRVRHWEGPAGATFRLSYREVSSRYGHQVYRTLRVAGRSGGATLDSYQIPTDMGALDGFLGGGSQPLLAPSTDEAAALGRFLAHITGWPLLDAPTQTGRSRGF